jgi:redox-sensitive bicupin YhaK (pirin superfamily)
LSIMALTRRDFLGAALALPAASALAKRVPSSSRPMERVPERIIDAQPTVEGAGVHLNRSLGSRALPLLDPFLLLDEIHSDRPEDWLPGFPTHPHRGFETVTYVVDGAFEHRDSMGNHGRLARGSAQWMTAGHGIVHSEMPGQREGGMWVFQLWVNLPAAAKMMPPRYQDIAPERIALAHAEDAHVRLVAGTLGGHRGPVEGIVTAPLLLDARLEGRGRTTLPVPTEHAAFAYVIDGRVRFGEGGPWVLAGQLAVLGPGDRVTARTDGAARFLLAAARPIGEPVARSGPFVMNTDAELQQAWADYRAGQLVAR